MLPTTEANSVAVQAIPSKFTFVTTMDRYRVNMMLTTASVIRNGQSSPAVVSTGAALSHSTANARCLLENSAVTSVVDIPDVARDNSS